jgi:hypothetical protein
LAGGVSDGVIPFVPFVLILRLLWFWSTLRVSIADTHGPQD